MSIYSIINLLRIFVKDFRYAHQSKLLISHCSDRTSKRIVRARINYHSEFLSKYQKYIPCCKSPLIRFQNRIIRCTKPYYSIEELTQFRGKQIVLFGHGESYEHARILLSNSCWHAQFRMIGNDYDKLRFLNSEGEVLIVANVDEIDAVLAEINNRSLHITVYRPKMGFLWGLSGTQYFDVYNPKDCEVVLDCGAFDGQTELEIVKWGGPKIKKIYAFELDPINQKKCTVFYEEHHLGSLVDLINKGTSKECKSLFVDANGEGTSGSCIGEGSLVAEVTRIDDEVKGFVSFIKMDIEGAELDSLKGAEETIKKNKPRLAICIYHKKSDIVDIPQYLLSIVPEYRFIVRHYSSNQWESVLYASVE